MTCAFLSGQENGIYVDNIEEDNNVERRHNDDSNNGDSSDESYKYSRNEQQQVYHTDHDNRSIEESDSDKDNALPGLQEQNRKENSNDDDSDYNQGDNESGPRASRSDEEYRLDDSDNKQKGQHQYFSNSTNIFPSANKWQDDNDDRNEYDGDNDDEEDDMPKLATRYPTLTLQL